MRFYSLLLAGLLLALPLAAEEAKTDLRLHGRQREKVADKETFTVQNKPLDWDAQKTAIVVCDMWDKHWCGNSTRRVAEMAPRMNEVLKLARDRGVLIIHCPSETMDFYKDHPGRKLAQSAPPVEAKVPLQRWCRIDSAREPALPIDDSDNGCDDVPQPKSMKAWSHQHAALEIKDGDAITDNAEAYYLMRQRGIENVIVMGVHTNMCVLGRPFSIRQLVYQGLNVALMRDMTDTMYNPKKAPEVTHCRGTDLVVEHIEKYWCPSITSTDFTGKSPFRFAEDPRPHIVALVGEDEYKTWETLPNFVATEMEPRGYACTILNADEQDKNHFAGLDALDKADALLVSVRRRPLPEQELARIRKFVESGKPVIGIRTASHAFAAPIGKQAPEGLAEWKEFDKDILGGNYTGHHGGKPGNQEVTTWAPEAKAKDHPILAGVSGDPFASSGTLYKTSPLADGCTVLAIGRVQGGDYPPEPIAWSRTRGQQRIFYTSLGHWQDFEQPAFRTMLANAVAWALAK